MFYSKWHRICDVCSLIDTFSSIVLGHFLWLFPNDDLLDLQTNFSFIHSLISHRLSRTLFAFCLSSNSIRNWHTFALNITVLCGVCDQIDNKIYTCRAAISHMEWRIWNLPQVRIESYVLCSIIIHIFNKFFLLRTDAQTQIVMTWKQGAKRFVLCDCWIEMENANNDSHWLGEMVCGGRFVLLEITHIKSKRL